MAPNKKQILTLYKQLLGKAQKFDNYNYREYTKRRVHDAFKEHKNLKEEDKITEFFNEGVDNLAMLNRQTTISQMFTFDKLVVEPLQKH
ncbi:hypothetical protein EJF18_30762 [Clavispora lusitaniae]|uniref:Complex 1 LYR protein domain-containing protein n=3 Tax=Clavispora lusitaniae TaxID=36911 RepID=C4Y4E6_CLAL4|nr:uncharacterized protein CLUG_02518 [Clavispora lusitaniae ATCC 42720]KAF5211377.1 hypothetical protein E0198_002685 [Clavispora lusitaniae]EEQ38392.1 hypothetical protein CLUG_02518 [Clavispora lusitaniae ATCC 42720]KAF7580212.1 Complex1_LYR-like family protein [Clavispora lusitaniae]OVF08868.1 hypothetical protein A9F13_07g03597 [Clavispora lusitaniae]QFZ27775.1 hypothetical protein EJF14_30762 [Clavispora lusitaniae]